MMRKLEGARKRAQGILDATDVSSQEKRREIKGCVYIVLDYLYKIFPRKWVTEATMYPASVFLENVLRDLFCRID